MKDRCLRPKDWELAVLVNKHHQHVVLALSAAPEARFAGLDELPGFDVDYDFALC